MDSDTDYDPSFEEPDLTIEESDSSFEDKPIRKKAICKKCGKGYKGHRRSGIGGVWICPDHFELKQPYEFTPIDESPKPILGKHPRNEVQPIPCEPEKKRARIQNHYDFLNQFLNNCDELPTTFKDTTLDTTYLNNYNKSLKNMKEIITEGKKHVEILMKNYLCDECKSFDFFFYKSRCCCKKKVCNECSKRIIKGYEEYYCPFCQLCQMCKGIKTMKNDGIYYCPNC